MANVSRGSLTVKRLHDKELMQVRVLTLSIGICQYTGSPDVYQRVSVDTARLTVGHAKGYDRCMRYGAKVARSQT